MSKRYLKGCAVSAALVGLFAAGAGATASPGGILTPVTETVSGTLNSLTGGLTRP